MKADLAKRSEEIVELELKLAQEHNQNLVLWAKLTSKDSLISLKDEIIKLNERDIASLDKLFNETQSDNKIAISNLYYAQAEALETAANRTHFAPRKKKKLDVKHLNSIGFHCHWETKKLNQRLMS